MASIAMPTPTASPLDAIAKALQVAHSVYGIKSDMATIDKAKQEQDLSAAKGTREQTEFDQKQAATAKSLDPTSQESKLARADAQSFLATIANSELGKKNPQAFEPLVALAKDENTNAATLQSSFEKSPLLKNITSLASKDEGLKYMAMALASRNANQDRKFDETQNKNANQIGQEFEKDPIIRTSKTNLNSLTRSIAILDNPNKPVTTKDLNLAYTDYINAVAAGGAATEGKIQRELPENFELAWTDLKAKAGTFDDLRKTETGAKLIGMLRSNISTVQGDLKTAVADQAQNIHDSAKGNTNPKVQQVVRDKLRTYAPERYNALYGGGQAAAPSGGGLPGMGSAQAAPNPQPNSGASDPLAALRDKAAAEIERRSKAAKK